MPCYVWVAYSSCHVRCLAWRLTRLCAGRYHELGSHALGQRRGWWIITIPQLVVMVGLGITCVPPCHTHCSIGSNTPNLQARLIDSLSFSYRWLVLPAS